jgi:hypothetical protein
MWINHPAREDRASVRDWLRWHISQWMLRVGADLEHRALYPNDANCPECGHWRQPGERCDHIPF